ncbi:MAG: TetR/AcrR family transcriptional regulator [Cyclobacteriaceae bacterium]|nr:TetR/AcrR family transcriptional regulator [Cyclobacteriaceae bacterium]
MKELLSNIHININDHTYLKDPVTSDLGMRIVTSSIDMIDEIGFESFTFRKLAKVINSTEASVYRYFENKHKLLIYLTSWYWGWMEYKLVFGLANISSPWQRLKRAIKLLTEEVMEDSSFSHINEVKLNRIVICDSSKVYLTKNVDSENETGAFYGYTKLVKRVSDVVLEINKEFRFPNMLISTIIEGAHHQRYFAAHLPKLTDSLEGEDAITSFYEKMVIDTLGIKNNQAVS